MHVGAAGCAQDERPCFPAAHVPVGRAESRYTRTCLGAVGIVDVMSQGGSGRGVMGPELGVKHEWKGSQFTWSVLEPQACGGKMGCGRKVWNEMARGRHSLEDLEVLWIWTLFKMHARIYFFKF